MDKPIPPVRPRQRQRIDFEEGPRTSSRGSAPTTVDQGRKSEQVAREVAVMLSRVLKPYLNSVGAPAHELAKRATRNVLSGEHLLLDRWARSQFEPPPPPTILEAESAMNSAVPEYMEISQDESIPLQERFDMGLRLLESMARHMQQVGTLPPELRNLVERGAIDDSSESLLQVGEFTARSLERADVITIQQVSELSGEQAQCTFFTPESWETFEQCLPTLRDSKMTPAGRALFEDNVRILQQNAARFERFLGSEIARHPEANGVPVWALVLYDEALQDMEAGVDTELDPQCEPGLEFAGSQRGESPESSAIPVPDTSAAVEPLQDTTPPTGPKSRPRERTDGNVQVLGRSRKKKPRELTPGSLNRKGDVQPRKGKRFTSHHDLRKDKSVSKFIRDVVGPRKGKGPNHAAALAKLRELARGIGEVWDSKRASRRLKSGR